MTTSNNCRLELLESFFADSPTSIRLQNIKGRRISHGVFTFEPTTIEIRQTDHGYILVASSLNVYVEHYFRRNGHYRGTLTGDELANAEMSGREPILDSNRWSDATAALTAIVGSWGTSESQAA